MMQNKLIFGITGGTGSGKSYVTGLFSKYNAYILDMDKLGHKVLSTSAYDEIVEKFGKKILDLDGKIDRKKLGSIVFSDKLALDNLNKIMYPRIRELTYIEVSNALLIHDIIVLDGAVIFEVGLDKICTHVILVISDEKLRIGRILARDKIDKEHAVNRIKSQRDYTKMIKLVDIVIENN